jgi:DNA polymerase elongation subunit (family B)
MISDNTKLDFYSQTWKLIDNSLFVFGLTANSTPVTCRITNWITTIDVKFRKSIDTKLPKPMQNRTIEGQKNDLLAVVSNVIPKEDQISHEVVNLSFYGNYQWETNSFHRLRIRFTDYEDYNKLINAICNQAKYDIPDSLNGEERFVFDYGLTQTQWLRINNYTKTTFGSVSGRRPIEITIDAKDIAVVPKEEQVAVPKALIVTIDIETFSSLHKQGRHPDVSLGRDIVYCISFVVSWSDSNVAEKNYCFVVLDESRSIRVPGLEIIQCPTEEELFTALADLINKIDPDAIIGYNVLRYDYNYINKRCESYEGLPDIGRVKVLDEEEYTKETFMHHTWTGAGGKYHEYHWPQAYGRVFLDAYVPVQKLKPDYIGNNDRNIDSGPKSHKLNDVGQFYCNETKKDLDYRVQYQMYDEIQQITSDNEIEDDDPRLEKALANLRTICEYCVQDSLLTMKVFFAMKVWINTRESASIMFQDMNDLWTTGMTRKFKAQLIRMLRRMSYFHIPPKHTSAFRLSGGNVEEPVRGFSKSVITFDFAGMYPSITRRKKICPSCYRLSLDLVPVELHYQFEKLEIDIEYGLSDLPGNYDIPGDFNLDVFLKGDDKYLFDSKYGYSRNYLLFVMAQEKYHLSLVDSYANYVCDMNDLPRFHKGQMQKLVMYLNQYREGVIPTILSELKEQRAEYKALKKKCAKAGDIAGSILYDTRQDAIKVLMNSMYGIYGTAEGNYGFMPGAAAITYYGRNYIKSVNQFLIDRGCKIIYGDTDSSFFTINGLTNRNDIIKRAKELEHSVNMDLLWSEHTDKPGELGIIQVELEKIMDVLCLKKKKYVGKIWCSGSEIKEKPELIVRGVAMVRGDTLPFTKTCYKQLIDLIFNGSSKEQLVEFYEHQMALLENGFIDNTQLVLSKTLNETYSSQSAPMNVYKRYLESIGEMAPSGTKLSFLIVASGDTKLATSTRYRPADTKEPIDYSYYKKLASTPLLQLIEAF